MAPTKKAAPAAKKASAHPTFLSMIQECVKAHPEEARAGVSRPTLKKFLAEKYKIDMSSAANVNNLNGAIKRGSEKGDLSLPKGIGGRVKVPAKAKSAAGKENVAPAPKKTTATKPAATKTAAKPAAKTAAKPAAKTAAKPAAKKASTTTAAAKKAPVKKAATATKPATKAAAPAKKTATAKKAAAPAKKTASGTKKAPAAKAAATKAAPKKAVAPKKKVASKK